MALKLARSNGHAATEKELAQAKWRSSGLSDRHAKRLKLCGLTPEQTGALGQNFHPVRALYIPYFDLQGHATKFFRVRYLEQLPGFAGQLEKPQRYAQEARVLNEVYLPPLFRKTWKEIAGSADIPLYITEGELKAAAGCAAGLATVGLGGVDVWRASKRGIDFLPALAGFKWKGRRVCIIYDSDLSTNTNVLRAQRALSRELLARGALVMVVSLPTGKAGEKQGLDDLLVASGPAHLEELIERAPDFPESDALWGFNQEVVYIKHPGIVVERESGEMMDPAKFKSHHYSNRHFLETVVKGKNVTHNKVRTADRWLDWECRSEMRRMTYAPGKPREHDGQWNVWPGWGCEPKKGDVGPWEWLLDFLFKDQVKVKNWFERWLAYPLQHPGAKLYTAALLWSREQRMGKTLVAYAMKGIYGRNFAEVKGRDLNTQFNYWAKNRQFIYADEINSKETRIDADWLKGIITQDTVTIKEKFLPDYAVPDSMNWYLASNHPDALFVEDRDGRYLIHEVRGKPADRAKYEWYDKWLHGDGPAHLFHHLMDLNLGNFNPREHAPETPGRASMIMLSKGEAPLWVQWLKEDPAGALKILGPKLSQNCDLFNPSMLSRAFDPEGRSRAGSMGLGKALAVAGFRQLNNALPIRTKTGFQRVYAIRNLEKWEQATRKEIADYFDYFHGPEGVGDKLS